MFGHALFSDDFTVDGHSNTHLPLVAKKDFDSTHLCMLESRFYAEDLCILVSGNIFAYVDSVVNNIMVNMEQVNLLLVISPSSI